MLRNQTNRRDFIKTTGMIALAAASLANTRQTEAQDMNDKGQIIGFPFRQIHLDFHTSEDITGIGESFDPDEFAETLQKAHVNSVTCFGRCHHGWIYYDTKMFPERRHPHLKRNLLAEQIEACHKRGIRVPIYSTIQWDHYTAKHHPEWLALDENGSVIGTKPFEPGFYRVLDVHTAYRDFLKNHLKELFDTVPVDGLFLDIVKPVDNCSPSALQDMLSNGIDPKNPVEREKYSIDIINGFISDMTGFIRAMDSQCHIFYNGGHVGPRHREIVKDHTHLELESLPSGGWGYLHFPLTVRYARKLTDQYLGMTGKFHTSWGDFHSFKNKPALEFECFTMLAHGASCSIGDQLHPNGKIDAATYELVGSVYSQIEECEPWCVGAKNLTEIAVFSPEEFVGGRRPPAAMGVVRMLQEGKHQFDVIDSRTDLSGYKVMVLPDVITLSPEMILRLEGFLQKGGAIIASHYSGLNREKTAFALKSLGLDWVGDAPYSPDFIVPKEPLLRGLKPTEHVMYLKGAEVKPRGDAEVLADVVVPFFNRTYEHFSSHRHTPSAGKVGYPGIVRNGNAIYFAHPIFTQYHQNAPLWCKTLFLNALDVLLPDPLLRMKAPSSTVATITEQPEHKRWVVHLLNYIPERRGEDFDTIEEVIPLFDVEVSILTSSEVKSLFLVPQSEDLPYTNRDGRVEFILPRLDGHQLVELNLA